MTCPRCEADDKALASFSQLICRHIRYSLGKDCAQPTAHDLYMAVCFAVRDRMVDIFIETERRFKQNDAKRLCYMSVEYLMGQSLENNLYNLGIHDICRQAVERMGGNFAEVLDSERDAALGNGGLGRLAACFLDSLATLDLPGYGYGINYEYGLFRQELAGGYQKEQPDNWITNGTPWQIERPDEACFIPLYGHIEHARDRDGNYNPMWLDWKLVTGVPHDMLIPGYGGNTVNFLRLFSARSVHEFDLQIFNEGDYIKAVEQNVVFENISKVLYPSDMIPAGRELRLIQEYFLVACTIRDIVRRYQETHDSFEDFADHVAMQMNDTHPSLAVAELMRVLVDEEALPWATSWQITTATLGYTNHTLMPEALETWSVALMERVLPRHLQIIFEINRRFLDQVAEVRPGDAERLRRMSIIQDGEPKYVRMAHLAIVGSHSVNGVSELHSDLIKRRLVPDFFDLWPEKFNNKTNGVTQRRFILKANPQLAELITRTIGPDWITDLFRLRGLTEHADEEAFQEEFRRIKHANKERLAHVIRHATGIRVDPASVFSVQVKRIHEYKRQLLNILHIVHEYLSLLEDDASLPVPRTYVFAGKAAPGYWAAKQIIKLITSIGGVINRDPNVQGRMKVVFVPDYRVSLAEIIIPGADLSEQISTAGTEASGTGNMKFAMNGALTMGTYDGANIEILKEVGEDNIYIFGLRAEAVEQMRREGSYYPRDYYEQNPKLKRVIDALGSDLFCPKHHGLFQWVPRALLDEGDRYFILADFQSYVDTQAQTLADYSDPRRWTRKAVLNVAGMGKFSSDRAIREYADDIWSIKSYPGE